MTAAPRRLRVLFVIDNAGALGGAERFVTGLAMHMPRDRVQSWVCSTRDGEPAAIEELREAGIPHLNVGRHAKWDVHRLRSLVTLVRDQRFDVVHAHKFGSNIWGGLIGRSCGVPVILAHEHNWSYGGRGARARALIDGQIIGRLATRFIAVSESNRERMSTLEGVPAEKIVVMPTAYIPHPGRDGGDVRAELGLAPGTPIIGVAAGLRPEKALDVMIESFARLSTRVAGVQLVIAGDGPCRGGLERQITRLGVAGSVHLLGARRDVDSILRGVDVGAMSSDWEGMPLFVFECMATDTPLVATAVGGLPEIVSDGETGLLVAPQNVAALADALERLLTDRDFAARLAARAAESLPRYTIDSVASSFADLYDQLLREVGAL